MGEKEVPDQKAAAATPEASGAELARLYKSGATLTEIATETGLGRFAVAYRLERAGVERRNRGTPQKTGAEKSAFARQQLEATFGRSLAAVTDSLMAGEVTVKALAAEKGIRPSTLATQFRKAGVEAPNRGGRYKSRGAATDLPPATNLVVNKAGKEVTIMDLVDPRDWRIADQILEVFSKQHLDSQKVAVASDEHLRVLGFTEKEILYMRKQLKRNGFSS